MIKRQAEPIAEVLLDRPHFGAIFSHRLARFGGSELCRGSVLIGRADEQNLMAARAHVSGVQIGWQLAADQVAQMLDPIDIKGSRW